MYFVGRKRADVRDTGPTRTPVSIGTCNLLVLKGPYDVTSLSLSLKRLARAKDHQVFACRRVHGRRRSTSPGRTPGPYWLARILDEDNSKFAWPRAASGPVISQNKYIMAGRAFGQAGPAAAWWLGGLALSKATSKTLD